MGDENARIWLKRAKIMSHSVIKGIVPPKWNLCHYLLNLKLFQTWNTKGEVFFLFNFLLFLVTIGISYMTKSIMHATKLIILCSMKESHTGLERHKSDEMLTEFSYFFFIKKDTCWYMTTTPNCFLNHPVQIHRFVSFSTVTPLPSVHPWQSINECVEKHVSSK